MRNAKVLLSAALVLLPALAHAWWSEEWQQRTRINLNTTSAGVEIPAAVEGVSVPVRLHSGNFDFIAADPDGKDLRVIAGDDQTPLPFFVERYDSLNELAIVWVTVPRVLPATAENVVYVYAGNTAAPAQPAAASGLDAATVAAFHFENDALTASRDANGLIGASAQFTGTPLSVPGTAQYGFPTAASYSVSLWIKAPEEARGAVLVHGPLTLTLAAGRVSAVLGGATIDGGTLAPATWSQLAVTAGGGRLSLYVNGVAVGEQPVPVLDGITGGELVLGDGFTGLIDEVQLAGTVRGPEWLRLAFAAQSADPKLIGATLETPDSADAGESSGYLGVLLKNLTVDAIVVIAVLLVMFLIAVWVMATKLAFVNVTDKANRRFLQHFRRASNVLKAGEGDAAQFRDLQKNSSLYRLYQAGLRELDKRDVGRNDQPLSGASLNAVRISVDADLVRESYRLNSQMVLLTIAISGGPFLGLLGTVVGVMITFAAIAAAGDVNVNAIAPGIAAALLATVAGLVVAIPALFGYNYLASRIKTISSDMQIFVDEFEARVAETYGAR